MMTSRVVLCILLCAVVTQSAVGLPNYKEEFASNMIQKYLRAARDLADSTLPDSSNSIPENPSSSEDSNFPISSSNSCDSGPANGGGQAVFLQLLTKGCDDPRIGVLVHSFKEVIKKIDTKNPAVQCFMDVDPTNIPPQYIQMYACVATNIETKHDLVRLLSLGDMDRATVDRIYGIYVVLIRNFQRTLEELAPFFEEEEEEKKGAELINNLITIFSTYDELGLLDLEWCPE